MYIYKYKWYSVRMCWRWHERPLLSTPRVSEERPPSQVDVSFCYIAAPRLALLQAWASLKTIVHWAIYAPCLWFPKDAVKSISKLKKRIAIAGLLKAQHCSCSGLHPTMMCKGRRNPMTKSTLKTADPTIVPKPMSFCASPSLTTAFQESTARLHVTKLEYWTLGQQNVRVNAREQW